MRYKHGETKKLSLAQQQRITKPLIEDVIPEYLDGDMKKNALNFIAYLRANRMKPLWHGLNTWKANDKGTGLYSIMLCEGDGEGWGYYGRPRPKILPSWVVSPWLVHMCEYEESILSEGLQNLIWDNVFYCVHSPGQSGKGCSSNKGCAGGHDVTILGKEFKGLCRCRPHASVLDPDEAAIHGIKRLLELERKARKNIHKR